ncbi:MAG: hypothetical protein C4297_14875 [Gemmataceae bacterium]
MTRWKLSIKLEALSASVRDALLQAGRLGYAGVELCARGVLAPDQLSQTGRRDLLHRVRAAGLSIAAIYCPLRHGLDVVDHLEARVERLRKTLALAYDLGAGRVIAYVGQVPESADDPRRRWMREALHTLSRFGERIGSVLLIEAGTEPPGVLRAFLQELPESALGVCFDPAPFLLRGIAPERALQELAPLIGYVYAQDARRGRPDRPGQAVPVGAGDLDWLQFLGTLESIGYRGWVTVRLTEGAGPDAAAQALGFLRSVGG